MSAAREDLLADLTDAQREAVTHRDGPLLVLAGPGSGKTTVVTRRVAHLIAGGVPPWQILALTFTNKAAGEMRQRIDALLHGDDDDPDRGAPTVATFHSFCARQLRRHAEAAGIAPGYSIYDEGDRREALKQAIADAELSSRNWTPAAVGSAISGAKNLLMGPEEYAGAAHDFFTRCVGRVYKAYARILHANDALDFDDLLLRMARLLRTDETLRGRLQHRYRYLLIDEYQDTNHAQFMIAQSLAAANGNICVVGDPDQSIYGWRGADIRNILEFEEHHPQAAVVPLGQNFRSTGHIVDAAAALIRNNKRRKHKSLFTDLEDGRRPTVVTCRDEHHEAATVAEFLRGEQRERGTAWKQMAVLYRVNALSRVLEEAFREAQIPYVIARGTAFYERKEIRDALAYLRLIVNPSDEVALRRIINTPTRGIGKTTLTKIEVFSLRQQIRLREGLRRAAAGKGPAGLSTRAAGAAGRFVALIDRFRDAASAPCVGNAAGEALSGLVEMVIRESGLEGMYRSDTEEDRDRLANLEELISAAADFRPPPPDPDPDDEASSSSAAPTPTPALSGLLNSFLESIALISDADTIDPERGSVTLMTLHAAKGLEFATIVVTGLEENLLPHSRAAESDFELEEERRLCFVGMTRAQRQLMLTRAAVRTHRGMRAATIASRFLGELPREIVDVVDHSTPLDPEADEIGSWPAARSGIEFPVGCIVRHPRFGLGRVEAVGRRASGASARVAFPTAGVKTLILDHAPLVRVDDG